MSALPLRGILPATLRSGVVVLTAIMLLTAAGMANAAGGGAKLESPQIDAGSKKSLQRGAKLFVNYCMACHSANYQRYGRLARDIGLSEEDVASQLIFTTDSAGEPTKIGSLMENNMSAEYGRVAFGVIPPNLALTARSRGVDWIYTYLKSFYLDPGRTSIGVNNTVYPGAAMPHVLWELQGWQEKVVEDDGHGGEKVTLKLSSPGSQSVAEYDQTITDITNFLAYMADPIKQLRHKIGVFVLLFLFVLLGIAYLLKKEYWRDVVH